MPMDKSKYPANWDAISRSIRFDRAKNHCEFCGAKNGEPNPKTGSKVVLTVAHLYDPDPMNCDPDNLAALCQACHLKYDGKMHAQHAKETRQKKSAEAAKAAGQGELFS